MRKSKTWAIALFALAAAALVLATGSPGSQARTPDDGADLHHVKKQAHFRGVVAELSQRDVSTLSATQRSARTAALERLAVYADAGRFPIDERFTGFGVPYLIDDHGTRCALAHLIDKSGASELVASLATTHNHAFVPALAHDRRLVSWLDANGLSVEDAAYIQLPPWTDGGDDIVEPPPTPEPEPFTPTTPDVTPDSGPVTEGDTTGRRRPATTRVAAPTWKGWWDLNRHAFVDLRKRYHDSAVVTGRTAGEQTAGVGFRPSATERDLILAPLLRKLAKEDGDIGASALMALARLGRSDDAAFVTTRALAYVGNNSNKYRGLMLLAIGLAKTAQGTDALAAIVDDSPAGRKLLGSRGTLPEQTRAYAAIALGLTGQATGIDSLLAVLAETEGTRADLRACAVAALGKLAQDAPAMQRTRVRAKLIDGIRKRQWHDDVAAAVPAALVHMQDTAGLETITDNLARFRKPTALRQSLALALGNVEPSALRSTAEVLLASARRDPDPLTRRYAIVALGQLSPGVKERGAEAMATRGVIGRFFVSALAGHHVQNVDRPWVYLGAALYGRTDPKNVHHVIPALAKAAKGGGARESRAAAALALGLVRGTQARKALRTLLEDTRDAELRPYVAEALGLLGDKESKAKLLKLVATDSSPQVRYRAALGLGYLADRQLVGQLVTALGKARSVPVRAALTRVIAEIGDRSAIKMLAAMATDETEDNLTRGRAIAALSLIGETADPTWVEGFKRGANRDRATPTLKVILSIF